VYCRIILGIVGKAIQAASGVSPSVKEETEEFPEGFSFSLKIWPDGPGIVMIKETEGRLRLVSPAEALPSETPDLEVQLKSLEAAWLLFSFQESTCMSEVHNRLMARGDIPMVCAFIRLMDKVEILLLPRFIASRAVKQWVRPDRLHRTRAALYFRTFLVPAAGRGRG